MTQKAKPLTIYGKKYCSFCDAAKSLCETLGREYEYIDVFSSPEYLKTHRLLAEKHGHFTFPLIIAGDEFIGGFVELQAAAKGGKLA